MILTLNLLTLIKPEVFVFNLGYSSSNALYSTDTESLTFLKLANCFDLMFKFTSNGILKPPVSILPINYLDRGVKYAAHIWIGRDCALSGRLLDNWKNLSNILAGLPRMSIPFLSLYYFLISEIWQHMSWTLNEFSTESCQTYYFLHIYRNTSNF